MTFSDSKSKSETKAIGLYWLTLYTEGSDDFVTSAAASIATGWSEPVPGRVYSPLWISAFPRRTE
jgi:hypothetical protein